MKIQVFICAIFCIWFLWIWRAVYLSFYFCWIQVSQVNECLTSEYQPQRNFDFHVDFPSFPMYLSQIRWQVDFMKSRDMPQAALFFLVQNGFVCSTEYIIFLVWCIWIWFAWDQQAFDKQNYILRTNVQLHLRWIGQQFHWCWGGRDYSLSLVLVNSNWCDGANSNQKQ